MIPVRQVFDAPVLDDVPAAVRAETQKGIELTGIEPGASVAIGAGSRGINAYDSICRETVATLLAHGAEPFIFPAMGSHGGATSEGQRAVLAHLGITEETMGCPIQSEIEPTQVDMTSDGVPVFVDRNALAADHVVLVNRIKTHTDFRGVIESGILKMGSVGLGKRLGASACHKSALHHGFEHTIQTVAAAVRRHCRIDFGIAILENAYEQTAHIEAIVSDNLEERERALLEKVKGLQAKLPFDELDLLIVDNMGKNISGAGMDTNIIGRRMQTGESEFTTPSVRRIMVCNLTEASDGNAVGIGFADFTTKRLVDRLIPENTWVNCITGLGPQKGRIPIHFDTDERVIEAAFDTIGMIEPDEARVVRINSTLHLDEVLISESMQAAVDGREDLVPLGEPFEIPFDDSGQMLPFEETIKAGKH